MNPLFLTFLDEVLQKSSELDALVQEYDSPPLLAICDHLAAKFSGRPIPKSALTAVSRISRYSTGTLANGISVARKYPSDVRPKTLDCAALVELCSGNVQPEALGWWARRISEEELSAKELRALLGRRVLAE